MPCKQYPLNTHSKSGVVFTVGLHSCTKDTTHYTTLHYITTIHYTTPHTHTHTLTHTHPLTHNHRHTKPNKEMAQFFNGEGVTG